MSYYDIVKDFAGPAAAILGAFAATTVAIAFGRIQASLAKSQADTAAANLQIAQQRVALDLFDRRWIVLEELRSAIAPVVREAFVDQQLFGTYYRAMLRAGYLFGPEVTNYLDEIRATMGTLMTIRHSLQSDNDVIRSQAADAEAKSTTTISGFYLEIDKLMQPYMSMHQRLPD